MKRLLRGSVVLAVAVGFLSCSGDPTSGFREPAVVVATPTALFIDVNETKPILVSLQDDQGNQVASTFEVSAVGSGITVVRDTAFMHTNVGTPLENQVRFQVTGTAIANSSFTITASGKSLVVPVRVVPSTVDIVISNATPALGDTITLTAPAGSLFTDSSVVTFAGGPAGDIVSVSPDQTVLTVVPGPNVAGAVTVSHTTVAFNPGLDFTITSSGTVTTPEILDLTGAAIVPPTPALGQTVTLTLPPTIKVLPVAALPPTSIGAPDTIGVLADSGLIVAGATNPRAVAVAVDSASISFIPAPNSDSIITVRGVVHERLPQFPMILSTTSKLTTPAVDSLPATLSSAAPAVNVPVVLTSTNASFTFVAPGRIGIGIDSTAIVTGQTASTITFLPRPGAAGKVGVGAVDVVGFGLPLTSTAPAIAVSSTVPSLAGTGSTGTAPALALPAAVGGTTGIYDSGPFAANIASIGAANRAYRLVVPGASSYRVTVDWDNSADIDVALCGEATCATPNFAAATGNHPEATTYTFVAAGTSYLILNLFAGDLPAWVSIKITRLT
ncbi:MAG: hypothetical protein QOH59_2534 [Gemmatimonadales bacterium]|jgi:hypothetical protein|nr:hypothetical protein [Gemmatimonadales bacterium]